MRPKPPKRWDGFPAGHLRAEAVPRPVSALVDSLPAGTDVPPHSHQRAQLMYAVQGTMVVRASGTVWILPASHALWVPPGVVHQIHTNGPVDMRNLYVQPKHAPRGGSNCEVMYVSPLLRELIVRAMDLPMLYDEDGMEGRLMKLALDEIGRLPAQPLGLRMPSDSRLLRLCERVLSDVSAPASIAKLGASVGLSERSVTRLFPRETGLSFGRWVNQAKLLKAFELFDAGRSVTQVALELGYSSPAAFTKMFRRLMGRPPTAMLS